MEHFAPKIKAFNIMQYNQIKSNVTTLINKKMLRTTQSKLENWIGIGIIWVKTLSKRYGLMTEDSSSDKMICGRWEKKLQMDIREKE